MSGYDHLLPETSSLHHLMHEEFGPPELFDLSAESKGSSDDELDGADLGFCRAAQPDAEPTTHLRDSLQRLAAIQQRASGVMAGRAAQLKVVGKPAPQLSAEEQINLAISRLTKIKARAAVAVESACRINSAQAAELDTDALKAHLGQLRELKQQVEAQNAAPLTAELMDGIQKLERLSSRAQSASFEGKGLEIRGIAIPYYQRLDEHDADSTGAGQSEAHWRSAELSGLEHDTTDQSEVNEHQLLMRAISSQEDVIRAVATKIQDIEVSVGMTEAVPNAAGQPVNTKLIPSRMAILEHAHDPRLASAAEELVHGQIHDLIEEDEANLPFLLRLLYGVGAMRGPMATRQRTTLLQLVRQICEAGGESHGPLLEGDSTAFPILEEEEQQDDICDDRYEDDEIYLQDVHDGSTETGAQPFRSMFDTFDSLDDIDEDIKDDADGDAMTQVDDALDREEVVRRVLALASASSTSELTALCSQFGLSSSGMREQLVSRLISHLTRDREMAELEVFYEGEEGEDQTDAKNPSWSCTRLFSNQIASEESSAPRGAAVSELVHEGNANRRNLELRTPGTGDELPAGNEPQKFRALAASGLQVQVGTDLSASLRSDDSDRPKTARGRPGADPFYYVSPTRMRPTSGRDISAPPVPMPIQRLTISAAMPPACSPLGSPFDPAIASADEAFAIEDDEDEEAPEHDIHTSGLSTSNASSERPVVEETERAPSEGRSEHHPPSSGEWSLVSGASASGGSCSSAEDQSPWEKVGTHEARVAAYLARGVSPMSARADGFLHRLSPNKDDGDGQVEGEEDEDSVRASDLPDARLNFGDSADAGDMSASIAALRARLNDAMAADASSATMSASMPTIAELRERLGQVELPPGIAMSDEKRKNLRDAWMSEQAATSKIDDVDRTPSDAANLVGDPDEGIEPTAHGELPSQTEMLNRTLLASFKDSLDRVGSSYSPVMEQASSAPNSADIAEN